MKQQQRLFNMPWKMSNKNKTWISLGKNHAIFLNFCVGVWLYAWLISLIPKTKSRSSLTSD